MKVLILITIALVLSGCYSGSTITGHHNAVHVGHKSDAAKQQNLRGQFPK